MHPYANGMRWIAVVLGVLFIATFIASYAFTRHAFGAETPRDTVKHCIQFNKYVAVKNTEIQAILKVAESTGGIDEPMRVTMATLRKDMVAAAKAYLARTECVEHVAFMHQLADEGEE